MKHKLLKFLNEFSPNQKRLILLMVSITIILCLCVFPPVSGKLTAHSYLNITKISNNAITWEYNASEAITQASLNGIVLKDFDTESLIYTAIDLPADSYNSFCIYTNNSVNCEVGLTKSPQSTNQDEFFKFIMVYIIFFIALFCCYVGLSVPFVGFGGLLFGLIGILTQLNGSITNFILYLCVIIAGIIIGFEGGKN